MLDAGGRGRVEGGTAGELVTVLAAVCPRKFATSVAGGTIFGGRLFETSASSPNTAVTYQARWNGRLSKPVRVWPPMPIESDVVGKSSVVVRIDTSEALQNLTGKLVELQRRESDSFVWHTYRRGRLKRDASAGSFPFRFTTTFTGVGRNLILRVRVPGKTGAPCFRPRATAAIRP